MIESAINLLVVDDSLFDHEVIARLLCPLEGIRIRFARNGTEAIEAVDREVPDLIVTDLIMPDMDGLDLVHRVRGRFSSVPMILMTAYGSEEVAMRALRAGATNYIPKKDLARDLLETVQGVLRVSTTSRQRRELFNCFVRRESEFEIGNDPDVVGSLMELVQEELGSLGILEQNERIRVGIALQEALTNALFHGNLEISSELRQADEREFYEEANARRGQAPYASRKIRVQIRIDRAAAVFSIEDDGPGFDTSFVDRPIEPEDLTRLGGRGLLLMRTFMDDVRFNRTGNAVTMAKRVHHLNQIP
jgi:CheY-like chemotaxis protein/anti-sigma regulatory factor (Ser/Thr protein kinase)